MIPVRHNLPQVAPLKHRRYSDVSRDIRTTIALGILGTDGLVLAADSEVTLGNTNMKGINTKMFQIAVDQYGTTSHSFGVSGAGSWNYFRSAYVDLSKAINDVITTRQPEQDLTVVCREAFQRFIEEFYRKHVHPFLKLKDPPVLDILLGVNHGDGQFLLASENASVRYSLPFPYDAIGNGSTHALDILRGCYGFPMSADIAVMVACYTVMRVKQFVSGCGHETQVIIIKKGVEPKAVPRNVVLRCEQCFANQFEPARQNLFYFSIGASKDDPAGTLSAARSEFDSIRQLISDTTS